VETADAGSTDAYLGAVPADLVLACGVFGNISDEDIERTVRAFPGFCAPGATAIWTRHRRPPDLTIEIRRWFADAGFELVAFDAPAAFEWSVGVHRFVGGPVPFVAGRHLFTFVDRPAAATQDPD
ncbi:MAG: SAM-dependent methyltransferase, partial [Candidatus Limnocylindrales bacterium]